jgi:hypothetical protein
MRSAKSTATPNGNWGLLMSAAETIPWARLLAVAIVCGALASANATGQTLHARAGQTVVLGLVGASVTYDEAGGKFRLAATLPEGPSSTPVRLVASLRLGQAITLTVPGAGGRPAAEVRLTRTPAGLDIAYLESAHQ